MAAIEGPVLLAIIWAAISIVSGVLKKRAGEQRRAEPVRTTAAARRPPETMDELLAEMREQLARAGGAPEPRPDVPAAQDEYDEEFVTREEPAEVVSMEVERVEVSREVRDYDAEAATLIRRRIDAADARNKEWTPADHRAFDAKIRVETPPVRRPVTLRPTAAKLREAMVWREILGPPVGWPDRDRR